MTTLEQVVNQLTIDPEPSSDSIDTLPMNQTPPPAPSYQPNPIRFHAAQHTTPVKHDDHTYDEYAPVTYDDYHLAKYPTKIMLTILTIAVIVTLIMDRHGDMVPLSALFAVLAFTLLSILTILHVFSVKNALKAIAQAYGLTVIDTELPRYGLTQIRYVRPHEIEVGTAFMKTFNGHAILVTNEHMTTILSRTHESTRPVRPR